MNIEYVSVGEITLDDTVLDTGQVRMREPGGGALYSALGIRVWGHAVGLNAVVGQDYPDELLSQLAANGVATEGIGRRPGPSLRLWLLHEENNLKQQLPKLQSADVAELDANRPDPPGSYWTARGYHLAPATPAGQMRTRKLIRAKRPDALISLDLFVGASMDLEPYRDGSVLHEIDIFSPSLFELKALWSGEKIERALHRLEDFGVRWVAVKMDTRGCLVCDLHDKVERQLPIYPVAALDTTGAGDAFSGGFLEGLVETGDVIEAGLRGTVSASFAIEQWGAMEMSTVTRTESTNRLRWLRSKFALDCGK